MSKDQTLNSDECWVCRRKKGELSSIGIELVIGEVPYEKGRDSTPGKAKIALCEICNYLFKYIFH